VPGRRNAQGVDGGRLALLLAVLQRRAGLRAADEDVFVSTIGGVKLADPGTDLAVALAVVSASIDTPLADDLVVMGEVGLGGEIRQVAHAGRRLGESARIGFGRAIVPASSPDVKGIQLHRVRTIAEALTASGLGGRAAR